MPDNDRVPRAVSGMWRRAARAGLATRPSAEVGDELRLALGKAIRDSNPPPVDGLARALRDSALYNDPERWSQEARDYLMRANRTDLSYALVRQGDAMSEVLGAELCGMSDQDVARELAGSGLRRWVDARVWGPEQMLPALVSDALPNAREARRYQESCLDHASIPGFADQMLSKDGADIRAPRTQEDRPTTTEMLDEEIEL